MNTQGLLFISSEERRHRSRIDTRADYDAFVEKFKPKKTTDDCYTPPAVYDAILGWLRENATIEGREVVRPFYPGGDFERFDYPEGCVVVDNPPFSILSRIVRFYSARGIRFFLFSPHLTLFCCGNTLTPETELTYIVCSATIVYENGANVNTDFISNLFGDIRIMTAPELRRRVVAASQADKDRPTLPKYKYPDHVTSAALLGKIAPYVDFKVWASECRFISKLDCQKGGTGIFGGGMLLSHRAAAEKVAAEKVAAEKAAEREVIYWTLSDREKRMIDDLGDENGNE